MDDQVVGGRFLITGGDRYSDTMPQSGDYGVACFGSEGGDGSKAAAWRNDGPIIKNHDVYGYHGHPPIGRLTTNACFAIVTDYCSKTVRADFNLNEGK